MCTEYIFGTVCNVFLFYIVSTLNCVLCCSFSRAVLCVLCWLNYSVGPIWQVGIIAEVMKQQDQTCVARSIVGPGED